MEFEDLSPEQKSLAIGKTPDELVEIAEENGIELSREQLDQIAGGGWLPSSAIDDGCPNCGSKNVHVSSIGQTMVYKCKNCGKEWM